MLSAAELRVLEMFHEYRITPGKMLCFSGQVLERYAADLDQMTSKKLLVKEKFKGAYTLTNLGFSTMQDNVGGEKS